MGILDFFQSVFDKIENCMHLNDVPAFCHFSIVIQLTYAYIRQHKLERTVCFRCRFLSPKYARRRENHHMSHYLMLSQQSWSEFMNNFSLPQFSHIRRRVVINIQYYFLNYLLSYIAWILFMRYPFCGRLSWPSLIYPSFGFLMLIVFGVILQVASFSQYTQNARLSVQIHNHSQRSYNLSS